MTPDDPKQTRIATGQRDGGYGKPPYVDFVRSGLQDLGSLVLLKVTLW